MSRLLIVGASGHGKVVADIAKKNAYTDIAFLDDNEKIKDCGGYPVIGKSDSSIQYPKADFIIAIGDSKVRERIQSSLKQCGLKIVTLIHPDAVVGENVVIGTGTVVMAGAVINPGTVIGEGCIINTCSSVDHDCKTGNFVHISVGSHVAGSCNIGSQTWIGAGAIINNHIDICSECMIGAGTVVVKDIKTAGTYIGVPAKKHIKQ